MTVKIPTKSMTRGFLESATHWSNIAVVVFGLLAAFAAALGYMFSSRLSAAKDADLRQTRAALETARADLSHIQERARPRTIEAAARSAILKSLRSSIPGEPTAVSYVSVTNEPAGLAFALMDILKDAGWPLTTERPGGGTPSGIVPTGVSILVSDKQDTPERAEWLRAALIAGGLSPKLVRTSNDSFEPGTVTLRVGIKP